MKRTGLTTASTFAVESASVVLWRPIAQDERPLVRPLVRKPESCYLTFG